MEYLAVAAAAVIMCALLCAAVWAGGNVRFALSDDECTVIIRASDDAKELPAKIRAIEAAANYANIRQNIYISDCGLTPEGRRQTDRTIENCNNAAMLTADTIKQIIGENEWTNLKDCSTYAAR